MKQTSVVYNPFAGLSGETVLVTGSTQNLGYSIARAFSRCGARVIVHGRAICSVAEAIAKIGGEVADAQLEGVNFDLGSPEEIDSAFASLAAKGWMPTVLVNNAAHLGLGEETRFVEQGESFFREVVDANLYGTFRCSQIVARHMKDTGQGGHIINVTSLAGERTIWNRSGYNTSKAALEGMTRSMAAELAPCGIRVNCISAGYIKTPRWGELSPEVVGRRLRNIPAGQPTEQDEIAELTLFLASGAVPTLIGSRIVIDGGLNVQQVPRDVSV